MSEVPWIASRAAPLHPADWGAPYLAVVGAEPTRPPGLDPDIDPDDVTPGVPAFLAIFALALVTVLLVRNMTARLRRLQRREVPGDVRDDPSQEVGPAEGGHPSRREGRQVEDDRDDRRPEERGRGADDPGAAGRGTSEPPAP